MDYLDRYMCHDRSLKVEDGWKGRRVAVVQNREEEEPEQKTERTYFCY